MLFKMFFRNVLLFVAINLEATFGNPPDDEQILDRPQNTVVSTGEEAVLKCQSRNDTPIRWKKGDIKISEKENIFRNFKNNYECINNTNLKHICDLKIKHANSESAGIYICAKNAIEDSDHYMAFVIVVDTNLKCETKNLSSDLSSSQEIFVNHDEKITINCSLTIYAHKSCEIVPKWYSAAKNKELSQLNYNVDFGINSNNFWISFDKNSTLENGTSFNLSVAFNCSASSKSLKDYQYAENVPVYKTFFTSPVFYFSGNSSNLQSTTSSLPENTASTQKQYLLEIVTITTPIAMAIIVIVALVLNKRIRSKDTATAEKIYQSLEDDNVPLNNYAELKTKSPEVKDSAPQTSSMQAQNVGTQNVEADLDERHSSAYEEVDDDEDGYDDVKESNLMPEQHQ